jgi:hypothetical protein
MEHTLVKRILSCMIAWVALSGAPTWAAEPPNDTLNTSPPPESASEANPGQILVEISLSLDHRGDLDAIKKAFAEVGITKIRHKVFQVGNPPANLAIGRSVPAPIARLAIRLAQTTTEA